MADIVKEFISFTSSKFFNERGEGSFSTQSSRSIERFTTDEQCLVLYVYYKDGLLHYNTEITANGSRSLVFYKNTPVALESPECLDYINITTFVSNPIESLYATLHHVYGPMLQTDASLPLDPKIQEMLSHLEAALRTNAFGKDGGPSLLVVLSVEDELDYWKSISSESKTRRQREMADSFISVLQPLADEIRGIESSSSVELKEIMESSAGLVDDLWRHSASLYPQKRMAHLMDIIGNACVVKLQDILSGVDLWSCEQSVASLLSQCCVCGGCWVSACHSLTTRFWPHHSLHPWEGGPHLPDYLNTFYNRLTQITEIKSIHLQLTKLLTPSEQESLQTSKMFDPFKGFNALQCSPSNNSLWSKAKSQFERLLRPAEDRIAEKLRPRLIGSSTKQMLHEFGRYSSLIERPVVYSALRRECEVFCSGLGELLREVEGQMGAQGEGSNVPDMSPLVLQLQWTKRMRAKVSEIESIIDKLLINLDGSAQLKTFAQTLQRDLANMETSIYEDWTRELQIEMDKKSLYLSPDSPVVEFSSSDSLMHVTFNPALVTLERNVRQLASIGYVIPQSIRDTVARAAQFMDHARALQQIATFHNTQADRMILSQRPMMLHAAMKLAALVKEEAAVPWRDTQAVALYVQTLREAVANLDKQNTYLTQQHVAMRKIVLELMETPLLQKQEEWRKGVRRMREVVEGVEGRGFTNNRAWLHHWDMQLYKALEHQYRSTLINPLTHLTLTRVELIFRQQEVRIQPPIEELRASVHSQLKRVISLPKYFVGLQPSTSEAESIFASIIPRNSWLIAGALSEVEKTLDRVKEVRKKWCRWAALGAVGDLENLCQLHLQQPQDWDRNFRECKAMGQSIAKLPMEDEKIEWILISSTSLRSELEAQNRRYWGALTTSLQCSLQQDSSVLEEYITLAQSAFSQVVPKNAKELAEASQQVKMLKEKESQMSGLLVDLRKKQSMVRAWGGERVRQLDHITKQWDALVTQMQNHQQLIVHQAESVKASLLGEWANLYSSLEVWHSKWRQNKPKPDQLTNSTFDDLKAKHQMVSEAIIQWEQFKEDKENMTVECQKFDMDIELKPLWSECNKQMSEEVEFWDKFKQFEEAHSQLSSQEWIVFQKKLHLLDEFINEWGKKLEPYTTITLFIQKQIDQYKEIIPSLKHLRSSDFTERHWREIYSLLDMKNMSANDITLGDILDVAGNIKTHHKQLQKIWSSASQEAVVRGAVAELELWMAGARFVLVKHVDSKGVEVPIVKDFKELLNKVEEYESLAGSARSVSASGGEDQLAIWEMRLSQLRTVLTSLTHIQRK